MLFINWVKVIIGGKVYLLLINFFMINNFFNKIFFLDEVKEFVVEFGDKIIEDF